MSSVIRNGIKFIDVPDGSSGKWSIKGGREYTVEVIAVTSSARVGPRQVLASTGLRYGNYYRWPICSTSIEWDFGSFLQDIDLRRDSKDGKQWKLSMTFQPYDVNHEGGADDSNSFDGKVNPFNQPPQVTWGSNKVERSWPVDFSSTPKAYVNAAGDPLEDPPKTEDSNPVVQIVRFEKTYDPTIVATFKNRTNLGTWLNFADNTMKCGEISAKRTYDPDWGVYWEVTYEFEYRPDTWAAKVLNAGFRALVSGVPTQIRIDNAPVSNPVCLASNGTFNPASPPAPNYLTFQPMPQVSFAALNIPASIFNSGSTA
jgi:hypothetical protein